MGEAIASDVPGLRIIWIDIAKGFGIALVVLGHVGRGMTNAGIPDPIGLLPAMDALIYAFHMPLFFLLSGVTFGMRPPAVDKLGSRIARLLWTLVLWTYAFLAFRALAGASANAGGGWSDLLTPPLPPIVHFWFLWALLLMMVVFAIARRALRDVLLNRWIWSLFAVAAICVGVGQPLLPRAYVPWFGHALHYSFAFAIGGLIGCGDAVRFSPSRAAASLSLAGFLAGLAALVILSPPVDRVLTGTALSLLALAPIIWISERFGDHPTLKLTALLGVLSLAIYVMHTIFAAALRIALMKEGFDALVPHLMLGTAVGLLGPIVAYRVSERLGLRRLAGLA